MIDPLVRPAAPDDADDIAQLELLETEARAALVGQRGGDRWLIEHPPVGSGWVERCRAPGVDVAVAHIDETVVGYLVAVLGDDQILRVDQVWVTPQARENGFGDTMLEFVMERGKAAGAMAVQGESLPGDRHTKNLYERAGIVARLITTYREL
ncbi:GNAT family N-acetyltransferase [Ilumatobacter nonamiensis]|uniref:GNAT family N-acetyltransferase n=1 Tax=Ilumatobacter nonamiensis TaxID=467093 RepID=UPI00034AEB5E|nr:GNAT family N-acetyltransferase [Ilumatobacter nonamiensis]